MKRFVLLFLFLGSAFSIYAHPHVFIKPQFRVVQTLSGNELELTWDLDAFFSASIIAENNSRNDGTFTAAETASIRKDYFENLKNFGYLTLVLINGKSFTNFIVTTFQVKRQKQVVVYTFRLKLPTQKTAYRLEVIPFDKSGYVAFEDLPKDSYHFQNETIKSDYFGSVDVMGVIFDVQPFKGVLP